MTKVSNKAKFLTILAVLFIGAVVFLSAPLSDKNPIHSITDNFNEALGVNTVTIDDESVAMGIPGESKTGQINWTVIGIAATAFCLVGTVTVIVLTSEHK